MPLPGTPSHWPRFAKSSSNADVSPSMRATNARSRRLVRSLIFDHDTPIPTDELHTHTLPTVDERATLTKARSMLILLLATCKQTQLALEPAANALDTDLTTDLGAMIDRTE